MSAPHSKKRVCYYYDSKYINFDAGLKLKLHKYDITYASNKLSM